MKIRNRQQLLLIVALAGVGFLVLDQIVLGPLTKAWSARSTRIEELKKSVDQGVLLLDREQTIRHRWASMRTNTLPSNSSAAESQVYAAFDHWSKSSGIAVAGIKNVWRPNDDFSTLEFRTDVSGNLQGLARFLYEIEKGPPALRIEAIEFTSRDNNGQQLTLGLQVSGLQLEVPPQP